MIMDEKEALSGLSERRLSRRILAYWLDKCGGKDYPSLEDIDPQALGADWDFCFVIDALAAHPFPTFTYMGKEIAKYSGTFLAGEDDWNKSILDKATCHLSEVNQKHDAILIEETLVRFDGSKILFRCVLLPLSEDGMKISHILGAANGRLEGES
jgi:hypothetical protein